MPTEAQQELIDRHMQLIATIEIAERYVVTGEISKVIAAIANLQLEIAKTVQSLLQCEIRRQAGDL